MKRLEVFNEKHWNEIKSLVQRGVELREIINKNYPAKDFDQLAAKHSAIIKYAATAQELGMLPEELALRWADAENKLRENKIYPYDSRKDYMKNYLSERLKLENLSKKKSPTEGK